MQFNSGRPLGHSRARLDASSQHGDVVEMASAQLDWTVPGGLFQESDEKGSAIESMVGNWEVRLYPAILLQFAMKNNHSLLNHGTKWAMAATVYHRYVNLPASYVQLPCW